MTKKTLPGRTVLKYQPSSAGPGKVKVRIPHPCGNRWSPGWAFSRTTRETTRWGVRSQGLVQGCVLHAAVQLQGAWVLPPHPCRAHSQGTTPRHSACSVTPGHASIWEKRKQIKASTSLRTENWKQNEHSGNKLYIQHFRFPCAWLKPLPLRPYSGRIVHSALSCGPRASVNSWLLENQTPLIWTEAKWG